jgi:parvulin-like peptidyl-prolyl isomerase
MKEGLCKIMYLKQLIVFTLCAFLTFTIFVPGSSGKVVEKILVIVNDDVITKTEFDDRIDKTKAQLQQLYKYDDTRVNTEISKAKPQILDTMIDEILFIQEAMKRNIQISDAEVQKEIDIIKKQFQSDKEFNTALEAEGYTLESLKREKKRTLLLQELIKQKFMQELIVTDDEVKTFYNENKDQFSKKEDTVKLKQLLIKFNLTPEDKEKTRQRAENLLKQCQEGADFGEMASKFSDDPATRANKGDIGYFIPGTGEYPELDEIVPKLAVGEISGLIEIPEGYDILKVTEISKDGKIRLQRIYVAILPDPASEKATEEKANSILKELKNGADFTQIVKKYSDDPSTKEKGGDWVELPIDNMGPELRGAFDSLDSGSLSRLVKTPIGFHIFKIDEKKDLTTDEIEQIRRYLSEQKLQDKLGEYSKKLRETAYIQRLADN